MTIPQSNILNLNLSKNSVTIDQHLLPDGEAVLHELVLLVHLVQCLDLVLRLVLALYRQLIKL